MMYWENGFYLEQNADKTRYEITDKYWQELLDLQSQGKEITTDKNGKPIVVEHILTPQELAQSELYELKNWYDITYTQHEQKYRRLHSLGKLTDEGANPYDELIKLYSEAEIKRARIQELERIISDSSK